MSESLASKYRPRTFQQMVGQVATAVVLYRMATLDRVPPGLLFSGVRGTGKTSAARILAAAMNCTGLEGTAVNAVEQETIPCGLCDSCLAIYAGASMDVIEIDAAAHGSVEDVRNLIEQLRFQQQGAHRVVILDEAHSMSREAFNALLKTLEEPPTGTVFILVTTEPQKLPEPVKDRLIEFEFRRVSPADIFERVSAVAAAERVDVESGLIERIAERSEGSVRDALMALDLAARAGITTEADYLQLVGHTDVASELLLAVSTGDASLIFSELDRVMAVTGDPSVVASQITRVLRDLLVLRSGGHLPGVTGKPLEHRMTLNNKLEPERILGALKILWDLKTRVRTADDARGSLELAIMLLAEIFTRGKTALAQKKPTPPAPVAVAMPAPAAPPAPKKLSLADIQARVGGTK